MLVKGATGRAKFWRTSPKVGIVMFSPARPKELLGEEKGWLMLAIVRDDTWNVLNMQYITPNSKRWDCSDILVGRQKGLKDLPAWMKVTTTLEKDPTPHPNILGELGQYLGCRWPCCLRHQTISSSGINYAGILSSMWCNSNELHHLNVENMIINTNICFSFLKPIQRIKI